jgi:hypothetical protein
MFGRTPYGQWQASWSPNATNLIRVDAHTELELLGRCRVYADEAEHKESLKELFQTSKTATEVLAVQDERDKQLRRLIEETDDSRREALRQYLETYQRQLREKEAEEQKPKPKENPYRRKFG